MAETAPCFDCGGNTRRIRGEHTFTYGLGADAAELTVTLPVHVCPSCGFECLDDRRLRRHATMRGRIRFNV